MCHQLVVESLLVLVWIGSLVASVAVMREVDSVRSWRTAANN